MDATLIITDVHADVDSLKTIFDLTLSDEFEAKYGQLNGIISLGDVLQRGYKPGPTVELLESVKDKLNMVLGNHDESFLYDIPVGGSDYYSDVAHSDFKLQWDGKAFFNGASRTYINKELNLLAVHGGPMDPDAICPEKIKGTEDAWLYTEPWQRISNMGRRFFDYSGYHVLPEDVFGTSSRASALQPNYLILCGHEHTEAAYREKNGVVTDVLEKAEIINDHVDGKHIHIKRFNLDDGNHLIRVGIAGPAGYKGFGWTKVHFGVLNPDERTMSLMWFSNERNH